MRPELRSAVNAVSRLRDARSRLARYGLALAIVAAATMLRVAVDPLIHDQIPYFIYVASVVVATWFCGVDGGIFSTVVAAFAGNYFFVPPRYEFIPHGEDWIAMTMFSVVAFGLVWLVGRWRRAERVLRRLHAEAEQMNRVKDEFLATLSHELRTPLNAILGWAQMLDTGHLDAVRRRQATRTIIRNAYVQSRLIEDVLDVSRIISGKMQLQIGTLDLRSVVSAAMATVQPAAQAKGVEIAVAAPASLKMVGDADRLQQVAWNLLSNAVKFTPKNGRVDVRIEQRDSHAMLAVADTGVGIDTGFLPHLFERFRQADSSTTREHGGLGLGLAVVRHLVELHGGTVRAESQGPNRGATFTVVLPIRAVTTDREAQPLRSFESASGTASYDEGPRLTGIKVLAVDDEQDARDLVNAALIDFGATVRMAASAPEAIEILKEWRPDVLVADIGMPGEDGYSLIARIRSLPSERGGNTPAIALTAYAQQEHRLHALTSGYQQHVAKPVTPQQIALAVATVVAQGRSLVQ